MISSPRLTVRHLLIAVAAVAVALGIYVALQPRRFDRAAWAAGERVIERQEMADDLIARRMLLGMTKAEISGLLGKTSCFYDLPPDELVYRLGNERGPFGIASEWLRVKFGPAGKAVNAEIIRD